MLNRLQVMAFLQLQLPSNATHIQSTNPIGKILESMEHKGPSTQLLKMRILMRHMISTRPAILNRVQVMAFLQLQLPSNATHIQSANPIDKILEPIEYKGPSTQPTTSLQVMGSMLSTHSGLLNRLQVTAFP